MSSSSRDAIRRRIGNSIGRRLRREDMNLMLICRMLSYEDDDNRLIKKLTFTSIT
jgi:hypothetical protein